MKKIDVPDSTTRDTDLKETAAKILEIPMVLNKMKRNGEYIVVLHCRTEKNNQNPQISTAEVVTREFLARISQIHRKQSYIIRKRGELIRLLYDDILYICSSNTSCTFVTKNGGDISVSKKLDSIEMELHSSRFLRCHRSYIVNMDYIVSAGNDFTLANNDIVPIRCKSRSQIKEQFLRYAETNEPIFY